MGGDPSLELVQVTGGVTRGEPGKQPGEGVLLGGGRPRGGNRGPDRVDRVRAGEDASEEQHRGGDSGGAQAG